MSFQRIRINYAWRVVSNYFSWLLICLRKYLDVDKSHFDQIRIIGAGTHSFIWLVQKKRRKSALPLEQDSKPQKAEDIDPTKAIEEVDMLDDKGNPIK